MDSLASCFFLCWYRALALACAVMPRSTWTLSLPLRDPPSPSSSGSSKLFSNLNVIAFLSSWRDETSEATGFPASFSDWIIWSSSFQSKPDASASFTALMAASTLSRLYSMSWAFLFVLRAWFLRLVILASWSFLILSSLDAICFFSWCFATSCFWHSALE